MIVTNMFVRDSTTLECLWFIFCKFCVLLCLIAAVCYNCPSFLFFLLEEQRREAIDGLS